MVVVTTEDKIRIVLADYLSKVKRRQDWIAPLGIVITLVLALLTSEFKPAFGLSADQWKVVFGLGAIASLVWLFVTLLRLRRIPSVADVIEDLAEGPS